MRLGGREERTISQDAPAARGFWMEPSKTRVGKHSLRVAGGLGEGEEGSQPVSVGDFLQEYMRQASSVRQVCT